MNSHSLFLILGIVATVSIIIAALLTSIVFHKTKNTSPTPDAKAYGVPLAFTIGALIVVYAVPLPIPIENFVLIGTCILFVLLTLGSIVNIFASAMIWITSSKP